MALRILTWLVSLGVHGAFALVMFMPSGGAALEQGTGDDIMVIEQGIALQGFAKFGEEVITVEAVEAPPVMMAAAQPLPETEPVEEQEELPVEEVQEVEPVEDKVIASETGPENELVEPTQKEPKEPEPEEVEQTLPPQVATVPQESVIAMRESSGEEKKGGDATAHRAYLGKLRTHLEGSKVNPRTNLIGTAVVKLMVGADGALISRKIVKSSGSKVLDEAAMASIERASPFPPIPENLKRSTLEVSVPFRFTVR
jgi:protein TonB